MWAGALWGNMALRWAGGVAAAATAGVAGAAVIAGTLDVPDEPAEQSKVAVVAPTPDLATRDGLTLTIESVVADDTQTTVTLTLEGRPELGRISGPPQGILADQVTGRLTDQVPLALRDQDGATYRIRRYASDSPRRWAMTFDPVPATTRSVTLEMAGVPFVAPAFETEVGQRPPDPSAVVNGPWIASATEIRRDSVQRQALDLPGQPLGPGTFTPFEVVQSTNGTLIRARITGVEASRDPGFVAWPKLFDYTGAEVKYANIGAGWGNQPDPEVWEQGFETVHGTVTLVLGAHVMGEDGPVHVICLDPKACPDEQTLAEHERARKERAAELRALLDSQQPPTWTFTIR
jgi:hypothetical protein